MVEQVAIPTELREQLERRNVLLFVGEGINAGTLPTSAELASELAERFDYPAQETKTLARVACFYELTQKDRHGLVDFLRNTGTFSRLITARVLGLKPPRRLKPQQPEDPT